MEPDRRPHGGSIVVRESPNGGGALLYLARDAGGRAVWVREVEGAEVHPTMREANRAALLAPASAGAHRPAYAVPASVLTPELGAAPVAAAVVPEPKPEPVPVPAPVPVIAIVQPEEAAPVPAAAPGGFWSVWSLWFDTWMGFLFRQERRARPLP